MYRYFLTPALLFMMSATPALALSNEPYLAPGQVDAILLLPPPPPANSELQKRELNDVLTAQSVRTPALIKRSLDDKVDLFGFANVMGPKFTRKTFPMPPRSSAKSGAKRRRRSIW